MYLTNSTAPYTSGGKRRKKIGVYGIYVISIVDEIYVGFDSKSGLLYLPRAAAVLRVVSFSA